jgi:hypothetical protein
MQTTRVDLPGAQWATIRTADSLKRGDQRAVRKAALIDVDPQEDETARIQVSQGIEDDMRDALIARLITEWSLDLPLPVARPDILDELDLATYDALHDATEEHWRRLDFKRKASTSSNSSGSRTRSAPNGHANGHASNSLPAGVSTP